MKSIAGLALVFATLAGYAEARELGRVEPASAGQPYDYIVHVPNTYAIGYNPEVRRPLPRRQANLARPMPGAVGGRR